MCKAGFLTADKLDRHKKADSHKRKVDELQQGGKMNKSLAKYYPPDILAAMPPDKQLEAYEELLSHPKGRVPHWGDRLRNEGD